MTTTIVDTALGPRELRNVFGTFATGVTVVTCRTPDGNAHGATVNAFTAVSLDPPLVQVTLIRDNRAAQYLEDAPFAVNILSVDQLDTCLHFAGKPMDREPAWCEIGDDDLPVLAGNAATIRCRPWRTYDGGDHVIVLGEVIAAERSDAPLLLFTRGQFREVGQSCGGNPWGLCADALDVGWFEGTTDFPTLR